MTSRGALAVLFCLLLSACGGEPTGPPEIRYGYDVCTHCRMIVSEARHAAAARGAGGEVARFDDLGCLVDFLEERPGETWRAWVHDGDGELLAAQQAFYARGPETSTPMGSGLQAFETEDAARRFARDHGGTLVDRPFAR